MSELKTIRGPFEPTDESLKNFDCPGWFRDAKLGFWAHWGPQAVPQAGDWYARQMYIKGHSHYKHHIENYGHPSEFGYKDIIKLWKAEKFDPEALVKFYKKAGARYFVSMAVHHDNFDLWNSKHHRWNAVEVGPQKDIVGLFQKAALEQGLHFGLSEHLERSYSWFNTNKGSDSEGPYDGNDPEYSDLYFEPHDDNNSAYPHDPPLRWQQEWFRRIMDLIEQYNPELLYTDGSIPFGKIGKKLVSNYYNYSIKRHNGDLESVYALKDLREKDRNTDRHHGEYIEGAGVLDIERGVVEDIRSQPWQTDTSLGDWYYDRNDEYKTPEEVIHILVDIVSKNGNLLLNVPLKPEGTMDEECRYIVEEIGNWMDINSEAIYGTRPWRKYGEGPTRAEAGNFSERNIPRYTARDFRFTKKDEVIYAICMNWPKNEEVVIKSFSKNQIDQINFVKMLGYSKKLKWKQREDGLIVKLPDQKPSQNAWVLKVKTK